MFTSCSRTQCRGLGTYSCMWDCFIVIWFRNNSLGPPHETLEGCFQAFHNIWCGINLFLDRKVWWQSDVVLWWSHSMLHFSAIRLSQSKTDFIDSGKWFAHCHKLLSKLVKCWNKRMWNALGFRWSSSFGWEFSIQEDYRFLLPWGKIGEEGSSGKIWGEYLLLAFET